MLLCFEVAVLLYFVYNKYSVSVEHDRLIELLKPFQLFMMFFSTRRDLSDWLKMGLNIREKKIKSNQISTDVRVFRAVSSNLP